MNHSYVRSSLLLFLAVATVSLSASSGIQPAQAVAQSGPTSWAPFGPFTNNLIITVNAGFEAMFRAFVSGQVDITDWPVQPADLTSYQNNPDFFLTSPTSEFGLFQLDFNFHNSLMGIPQLTTRTTSAPGIIGAPTTAPACSTGFGQIKVNLLNKEEGNSVVKDSLNQLTAVGPQTFAVSDLGGSSPNGTYILPGSTSCMIAGSYKITSSVYDGGASVFLGSFQKVSITLGVNYKSPSTQKLTLAGMEFRRAMAHLIDKPNFVQSVSSIQGNGEFEDIQVPPSQTLSINGAPYSKLPQSILDEDKPEHPWFSGNVVSGYNLHSDAVGGGNYWWATAGALAGANIGYSGFEDLRAACDHLRKAGLGVSNTVTTDPCNEIAGYLNSATQPAGAYPHLVPNGQVTMYIRTHAPRKAFGQIVADSINALFGTPSSSGGGTVNYGGTVLPVYYSIDQVTDIVFSTALLDDWSFYTGGFSVGSTPDHLFTTYHSSFAGNICGGVAQLFPSDYPFYCNPSYDSQASAGEFSGSLPQANGFFGNATVIGHRAVMTVPVFSRLQQFVGLNGWNFQPGTQASLVNVLGHGFQIGFQSLLNMRQRAASRTLCTSPGTPIGCTTNSNFIPGGGNPDLIRRGFSQAVHKLSPFQAVTVWDFEVLNQVYDSMMQVNPLTGGTGNQFIDWMTTTHSQIFNPGELSCVRLTCVNGTTTQTWYLRNDLVFHDGTPVTADDVVYSILAYRDVPSANLLPSVSTVSSAVALNPNTVQVKLQLQSPFYEINIGSLPIIPKHLWQSVCGNPPSPASQCASASFDPMNVGGTGNGIFVGSGPWVCRNINTGIVGGSCVQNGDGSLGGQDISTGGRVLLIANQAYQRGLPGYQGSSLQKNSWADKNDDGMVNILDIADAALRFGKTDPYWDHPLYGTGSGLVDITDIALVAFYFEHDLTGQFTASQMPGIDPQLDPYKADLTGAGGPVAYYEGGKIVGSGQLSIKLVALTGPPSASSFTARLLTDPGGALVATATGTGGGLPSVVLLPFTSISPGKYVLQVSFGGSVQPILVMHLNV